MKVAGTLGQENREEVNEHIEGGEKSDVEDHIVGLDETIVRIVATMVFSNVLTKLSFQTTTTKKRNASCAKSTIVSSHS